MFDKVYGIARYSVDPRTKIGCVIECDNDKECRAHNNVPVRSEKILKRIREDKNFKLHVVEHAEILAIRQLEASGLLGTEHTLWVNEIPCAACARSIVSTNIKQINICQDWLDHRREFGPSPDSQLNALKDYMSEFGIKVVVAKPLGVLSIALRDDMEFEPGSFKR